MSSVQPPLPPAPPASVPPTAAAYSLLQVKAPPVLLSQLDVGTRIEAMILNASRGQAEFFTPLGRFTAPTTVPLQTDQLLVLQVPNRASSGQFLLQILGLDGKPLQPPSAQSQGAAGMATSLSSGPLSAGQSGAQPVIQGQTISPGTATSSPVTTVLSLTAGSTLSATVLGASPVAGSLSALPGSTVQGAPLAGQTTLNNPALVSAQLAGTATAQSPASPSTTSQTGPQAPPGSPALTTGQAVGAQASQTAQQVPQSTQGTGGSALPAGTQFSVTIQNLTPAQAGPLSVALPGGTAQAGLFSTGFSSGQVITGTVIGSSGHGQSVVLTPGGTLSMATTKALPPGTGVTFKISSSPIPPPPEQPLPPSLHREGMIMSQTWSSLEESLGTLQNISPQTAQMINSHVMPKPDAQFSATTLFFLSALKGGNVRSWIGENASRILEKMRPDTMRRLSDDFRLLGFKDDDPAAPTRPTDWRSTLIPLQSEDGLQQIRFFTRKLNDDDENQGETDEKGTHFLIDVKLSKIGRLQLDGMVEKTEKRLNMIVRTSTKLPGSMRQDIALIFENINQITGLNGAMSFQAAPDAFVDPKPHSMPQTTGLGIIV